MVCNSLLNSFTPKYLKKTGKLTNFYWKTPEKCLFPTQSSNQSLIKISPKYGTIVKWSILLPCNIHKKLETFNDPFPRKCPKTQFLTLNPLISTIKIFFNILAMSLFLLYWPQLHAKFQNKLMSGLWDIQRQMDRRMDQREQLLWTPLDKPWVQKMGD